MAQAGCSTLSPVMDGVTVLFGAVGAVAAMLAVLVPAIRGQGAALRREIERQGTSLRRAIKGQGNSLHRAVAQFGFADRRQKQLVRVPLRNPCRD